MPFAVIAGEGGLTVCEAGALGFEKKAGFVDTPEYVCQRTVIVNRARAINDQICFAASSLLFSVSVAMASRT